MEPSEQTRRCLVHGRALYDRGAFWDAHEAWEEAWQEESGEVRLLLQGLIQVAAAMHKAFVQRQPGSCCKLLTSALQKLDPLAADLIDGLALDSFRASCRLALAHAETWSAGAIATFDPALSPRLESSR